jgi:membrane protease YdiL (CAAX protease family)
MRINYVLLLFLYSPVLLLLAINLLRDRFVPENKVIQLCTWSLFPGIGLLILILSQEGLISLWFANLIPVLKNYPYNNTAFEISKILFALLLLVAVYSLLHFFYKVRFLKVFDVRTVHLPFILKACGILAVINVLSIYFVQLNLLSTPQSDFIKSLDRHDLVLALIFAIVLAPIEEEIIFRGLLYAPLYRKVGRELAIVITSLIWTQTHFQNLPTSISIFIIGIILGWLYSRSGSLLTTIILHSFKNSWILVYLLKSS